MSSTYYQDAMAVKADLVKFMQDIIRIPSLSSEEGAVISPTFLVREGEPNFESIFSILRSGPFPSRHLSDNALHVHVSCSRAARARAAACATERSPIVVCHPSGS